MKNSILTLIAAITTAGASAQSITATWPFSNPEDLSAVTVTGDASAASLIAPGQKTGSKIAKKRIVEKSGADTGLEPVDYNPPFTAFTPYTKVTSRTDGHCVSVSITPQSGHTFKPTSVSFDAAKIGTDGGSVNVYYTLGSGEEIKIATGIAPLRNKITASNTTAYSHHEFSLGDVITKGEPFTMTIYFLNINGIDNSSPKEIGLRNVSITGAVDEEVKTVGSYIKSMTCTGIEKLGGTPSTIDLTKLVANLKNGETIAYDNKLYGDPYDFTYTMADGYESETILDGNNVKVNILKNDVTVMTFGIRFKVTHLGNRPAARPLNRGLMAISLSGAGMGTGNLVSWRHREADGYGVKYKLYRGDEAEQNTILNNGLYIIDRTNFADTKGSKNSFYRLETYDEFGNLLETEISRKTWDNQTLYIPTETPIDKVNGATYTPNDASYCDMDGDGEYEIILKWSPSNEKDAASTGTTSPAIFDCIKLDGTRLWRINAGPNFFTSAHTMQFIAWDFDGDGYGEFMMKTAPGTIDGEGNYVILGNDNPEEIFLSGRGKQDHGPEYITVFDGLTGAELATIPYHTDYQAGKSYWGDDKQNRSERYLAALAYLDGPDANPSPIFARGYYAGAFVAAYDWDGKTLKERWVSRNTTKGKGLWGEGAHWVSVGDCDGDGFQEIVYGSAALDHDGSLLYRTGLGHGDALHLGDFLPERPGLEVFMVHEEKPYGYDLRDAATGEFILHKTESGDTGRGLAAHFDTKSPHSQFLYSASTGVFDCADGSMIAEKWTIGSSGAGINNRIYWDGDLYDEFFDKSIIAHWNSTNKWFDRYKVNNGNYVIGKLNNGSKFNPCVLGDLLGDWREEIVTWDESNNYLIINATSYKTNYRIPHLMDDLNYRVQVVNQNCCYNQPPHLSFDPAIVYAENPNVANQENNVSGVESIGAESQDSIASIYTLQGIKIEKITAPGMYILNGKKVVIK
ncbi:MAG: hypothetical protein K2N35_10680 [Muribaculaceae bacterium]|nr:hypothetical protein [Muribaculaceae bacterium]